MRLTDILRRDMVWAALEARTKPEVIKELSSRIAKAMGHKEEGLISLILEEREKLGSTGIQDGIAIPHGKIPGFTNIVIACGRSVKGIEFDAHDAKPTHLFFVLLVPEFAAGQHLKALARLSRLLKDSHFREKLLSAEDAEEIYRTIILEDEKI